MLEARDTPVELDRHRVIIRQANSQQSISTQTHDPNPLLDLNVLQVFPISGNGPTIHSNKPERQKSFLIHLLPKSLLETNQQIFLI